MSSLLNNPYAWDSTARDIHGPVTSLKFTDERNLPINVKGLHSGKEIQLVLPRSVKVVQVILIDNKQ